MQAAGTYHKNVYAYVIHVGARMCILYIIHNKIIDVYYVTCASRYTTIKAKKLLRIVAILVRSVTSQLELSLSLHTSLVEKKSSLFLNLLSIETEASENHF